MGHLSKQRWKQRRINYIFKKAKNEEMKLNIHLTRKSHHLNLNFGHTHSLPREQHAEIEKNKKWKSKKRLFSGRAAVLSLWH